MNGGKVVKKSKSELIQLYSKSLLINSRYNSTNNNTHIITVKPIEKKVKYSFGNQFVSDIDNLLELELKLKDDYGGVVNVDRFFVEMYVV